MEILDQQNYYIAYLNQAPSFVIFNNDKNPDQYMTLLVFLEGPVNGRKPWYQQLFQMLPGFPL